jgi:hypothetical protein
MIYSFLIEDVFTCCPPAQSTAFIGPADLEKTKSQASGVLKCTVHL